MKLKILAAVLAMLLLFSACGKTNSHKNNTAANNGGSASSGSTSSDGEAPSEQEEEPQESGELVCVIKNRFDVNDDETYNAEYPVYLEKYYYDGNGNLVREEMYNYNTDKYQTVVSYTEYEYDENGHCIHEYSDDGNVTEEYYEYDDAGNQTHYTGYVNGDKATEKRWDYDDHGNVIADYEPNSYGDGLEYTSEYEYNSDGTVHTKTSYEADYGHQSAYIEYTYGENGLLARMDVTSYGEYKGYWEYIYDEYGVVLEAHRYNEYGYEDDEDRELYYTEYDEAGNQITYAELYTTGYERGTPRYTLKRTFDSNGNVTEELEYNYDGKLDKVVTYEYAPLSTALWG